MKILIAIKQVPERDASLVIAADGRWIEEEDLAYTINEPDAYALEEALLLRERTGTGEVVVVSAGPERVATTLRDALAKGADRAIHLQCENLNALDSLEVARLLAGAAQSEAPNLILTGLQSDDLGAGQTGVILAELLGIPCVTLVKHVETTSTGLRVTRELEDGWFQHIAMPLPALLTIQSGGNKLRYATLMGIKKAKNRPTETVPSAACLGRDQSTLDRVYLPNKLKQTEMLAGTTAEVATQLVQRLRSARLL